MLRTDDAGQWTLDDGHRTMDAGPSTPYYKLTGELKTTLYYFFLICSTLVARDDTDDRGRTMTWVWHKHTTARAKKAKKTRGILHVIQMKYVTLSKGGPHCLIKYRCTRNPPASHNANLHH